MQEIDKSLSSMRPPSDPGAARTGTSAGDAAVVRSLHDEPEPFKFSDAKDIRGLPMEHAVYAKSSCKNCYGRGYVTKIIGNGYAGGRKIAARDYDLCGCLHKGYSNVRRAFEAVVTQRVKDGGKIDVVVEHERARVYERLFPDLAVPQTPSITIDGKPVDG